MSAQPFEHAAPGIVLGRLIVAADPLALPQRKGEAFDLYSLEAFGRGSPEAVTRSPTRGKLALLRAGDVLLSRAMNEPRRAWVVAERHGHSAVATPDWLVLRPTEHDPGYLRHLLVSNEFHLRLQHAAAGARLASPASARIRAIVLPAPDIVRQRALGRLLDGADALRAKRRRSLHALERLAAASTQRPGSAMQAIAPLRQQMDASRLALDVLLGALRDRAFRDEL